MEQHGAELIFICYNRKDLRFAKVIESALLTRGHNCWRDETSLSGGDVWLNEISNAIERATVALVLLGSYGVGRFQEYEINRLVPETTKRKLRLIPVVVPGFREKTLPSTVSPFQSVDLTDEFRDRNTSLTEDGLARLRRGIVGKPAKGGDMKTSDHPSQNPLFSFLERLSEEESSIVASVVLAVCRAAKSIPLREQLKLNGAAQSDILFADECLQSANTNPDDPLARDDALKAFVIVGSFLGSVLQLEPASEQLAWDAAHAVLAQVDLELWVSKSKQSEITRLFFEPKLYFQDDELLVELRGIKMTRGGEE